MEPWLIDTLVTEADMRGVGRHTLTRQPACPLLAKACMCFCPAHYPDALQHQLTQHTTNTPAEQAHHHCHCGLQAFRSPAHSCMAQHMQEDQLEAAVVLPVPVNIQVLYTWLPVIFGAMEQLQQVFNCCFCAFLGRCSCLRGLMGPTMSRHVMA